MEDDDLILRWAHVGNGMFNRGGVSQFLCIFFLEFGRVYEYLRGRKMHFVLEFFFVLARKDFSNERPFFADSVEICYEQDMHALMG